MVRQVRAEHIRVGDVVVNGSYRWRVDAVRNYGGFVNIGFRSDGMMVGGSYHPSELFVVDCTPSANPERQDNDGREACYSCGSPTKQVAGFTSVYTVCTRCGK